MEEPEVFPVEWEQQLEFWDDLWNSTSIEDDDGAATDATRVLNKKRVLILISDTGGGHRASAKALADAIESLFPRQVDVSIRDLWTEVCPWPYNKVVQMYMNMAKKPWKWRLFWFYSKFFLTRFFTQRLSNVLCRRAFVGALEEENPDLIISVHPAAQHLTLRVLRHMMRKRKFTRRIPLVTVVTDLGSAHPMWFHPEADMVFVPSESTRRLARRCRVRPSAITKHGLPLRRAFWVAEPRSRAEVREALGLVPTSRTVLVVGGGDGVGKLTQIAECLSEELSGLAAPEGVQLVVICGKNAQVRRAMEAKRWPRGVQVRPMGFVTDMDQWMGAADVIVTKAGPGTIAESCTRGLPVMLSSYLPGQEQGNVDFVVKGGFGDYQPVPRTLAQTVARWLREPATLEEMSRLSLEASQPQATLKIAQAVGEKFLTTDTSLLAAALSEKVRASAVAAAAAVQCGADDAPEECVVQDLGAALQQLNEARSSLVEAQLAVRTATIQVRRALAEETPQVNA